MLYDQNLSFVLQKVKLLKKCPPLLYSQTESENMILHYYITYITRVVRIWIFLQTPPKPSYVTNLRPMYMFILVSRLPMGGLPVILGRNLYILT